MAQDGTGNFQSVQAAIDSIPRGNTERVIIFIRNGTYHEHLRLDRSFVTLLGEDRAKTWLVWEINDPRNDPKANADRKGIASFNLRDASDVVIDRLTIDNPAKLGGKPVAKAVLNPPQHEFEVRKVHFIGRPTSHRHQQNLAADAHQGLALGR